MPGTWIYSNQLPYLAQGDIVRDRRTYQGETQETNHMHTWDAGMPGIQVAWYIEEITRNGWYTLRRMVKRHGVWEDTDEVLRYRGRKALPLMIVALAPADPRWKAAYATTA